MPELLSAYITYFLHFTWIHMRKLPMSVTLGGGREAGFQPFCITSWADLIPKALHGAFYSELQQKDGEPLWLVARNVIQL